MRINRDLAQLETLAMPELQALWLARCGGAVPRLPQALLVHALAWHLQEKRHGGLSTATRRALERFDNGEDLGSGHPTLSPGTQLVRTWHGRTIIVSVEAEGFRYDGVRYASLTSIARKVTGVAWSGPRFFGLVNRAKG